MALKHVNILLALFFVMWLGELVHPAQNNDFECYVCKNGQGIECNNGTCMDECNDPSDIEGCPSSSPWCEIEVKNHGGDLYMTKRCRQEEACFNQQNKNADGCTDADNPYVVDGCTFCCNETICNYNLNIALRVGADYEDSNDSEDSVESVRVAGSVTFFGLLSYLTLNRY